PTFLCLNRNQMIMKEPSEMIGYFQLKKTPPKNKIPIASSKSVLTGCFPNTMIALSIFTSYTYRNTLQYNSNCNGVHIEMFSAKKTVTGINNIIPPMMTHLKNACL